MEFLTSLLISLVSLGFAFAAHRKHKHTSAPIPAPVLDEGALYAARRRAELAAKKETK